MAVAGGKKDAVGVHSAIKAHYTSRAIQRDHVEGKSHPKCMDAIAWFKPERLAWCHARAANESLHAREQGVRFDRGTGNFCARVRVNQPEGLVFHAHAPSPSQGQASSP